MGVMPVGAAFRFWVDRDPDKPAVTEVEPATGAETTISWGQLERRSNRLARAYEGLGVGQDDLVTVGLPNGIEFYAASLAIWKLGATPQPISYRLPDRERQAIVELADPPLVVGVEPGLHGDRPTVAPGYEPDADLDDGPLLPDRTAASMKAPTSGGSTGRPKIILSGSPAVMDPEAPGAFGMGVDGVHLVPGPMYHNAPFMFSVQGLLKGNHLVVMRRFDAARALQLIDCHRCDWALMVPTMMLRIWRLPDDERLGRDLSSLKGILHLAAPCPAWLKEAWIDWLGPEVIWELYAGTEAQGVTIISGQDWLEHKGSVGRPAPGTMKICDEEGNEVGPGVVGEVWMRPPAQATYRYIGAEARVSDDGWESLGDMGSMDADGFLYLADRRADMILSGGANVYPAEVEAALDEHPAIRSCAVIGLPDDDLGSRVHAVIQAAEPIDEAELKRFLAERLVTYKIPRSFELVDEPVRDDAGKVRRSGLAAQRSSPAP